MLTTANWAQALSTEETTNETNGPTWESNVWPADSTAGSKLLAFHMRLHEWISAGSKTAGKVTFSAEMARGRCTPMLISMRSPLLPSQCKQLFLARRNSRIDLCETPPQLFRFQLNIVLASTYYSIRFECLHHAYM